MVNRPALEQWGESALMNTTGRYNVRKILSLTPQRLHRVNGEFGTLSWLSVSRLLCNLARLFVAAFHTYVQKE